MADLTKETVKEIFNGTEYVYFMAFVEEEKNEVLHIVGFMESPSVGQVTDIINEVKSDPEFKLEPEFVDTLQLRIFSFPD